MCLSGEKNEEEDLLKQAWFSLKYGGGDIEIYSCERFQVKFIELTKYCSSSFYIEREAQKDKDDRKVSKQGNWWHLKK